MESLVKELRVQNNMSQEAMAVKLGTTQSRISKIESGELKLERDIALGLHEVFKISMRDIAERMKK